ncbi:STAS domain-containing protein [Sorangium sp. So ce429]
MRVEEHEDLPAHLGDAVPPGELFHRLGVGQHGVAQPRQDGREPRGVLGRCHSPSVGRSPDHVKPEPSANGYFLRWVGLTWDEVAGKTDHELFPKESADAFRASDLEAMTTGRPLAWENSDTGADGQLRHFAVTKFPLIDAAGALRGVCGISTDISSYKRAEEENRQLQAEIIRAQEMSLRALSTPLLPIARGVIVMPLIGTVDQGRAQRVLEALLGGIVTHEARKVILDITGVPVVDAGVADALIKTAQAVKLLGATVILTGIQPKIAQTLVELGVDLSSLVTRGTLESGIAHVLDR